MEDAAIVDLYWQRSDRAISETNRKYGRYCHSIAFNFVRNNEDAEECVNDTWFRAWNLMPDKRPSVLSTFLGAITRNLAVSMYRGKTSLKRGGGEMPLALDELSECVPSGADLEREYEIKEFESAIGKFVEGLPAAEQKVFVARYWYLAPVSEIAEKMHFTQGKTKSMLFRIRNKLREYMREEGLC